VNDLRHALPPSFSFSFLMSDVVASNMNLYATVAAGLAGAAVLGYFLLIPMLNKRARAIMVGLLNEAGIKVGTFDASDGADIIVHDENMWLDWMSNGMLAIGESYMAKQWESKTDLDVVLYRLMALPSSAKRRMFKSWNAKMVALSARVFNYQSVARAGMVGAHHYDEGNDFYAKWLDPALQYSCAYWKHTENLPAHKDAMRTPEALESAQIAKMRLIGDKLKLEPGMTVLEIGCGWGGLAVFLAKEYNVHVTGITISNEQLKGARERAAVNKVSELTSFEYEDYRTCDRQFDRVVSIAMLEAVGYKNLDHYFNVVRRCTKEGGLAVVHSICANRSTKTAHQRWITRYIFPNGFLPSLKQCAEFAERKFAVEDVHNLGPDYDKTLMCWHEQFQSHYAAGTIERPVLFKRMWEFYLVYCAAGFRARTIQLYQFVLTKHRAERYDAPR
jgi:cyclopropane-fatty-acyl-phospholipid synthase